MFFKLRKFISQKTLQMLYYALVDSRIKYVIIAWGNSPKAHLQNLAVKLSNILRTISYSSRYHSVTPLYKLLNLLKTNDIYKLELAKFFYQLHYDKTPMSIYESLTKILNIHKRHTRNVDKINYFLSRVNKSIGQG